MALLGLEVMGINGGEVKRLDFDHLGTIRRLAGASPKTNPSIS